MHSKNSLSIVIAEYDNLTNSSILQACIDTIINNISNFSMEINVLDVISGENFQSKWSKVFSNEYFGAISHLYNATSIPLIDQAPGLSLNVFPIFDLASVSVYSSDAFYQIAGSTEFDVSHLGDYLGQTPLSTEPCGYEVIEFDLKTSKVPRTLFAGTFDQLHGGHKLILLYTALAASNRVSIGVTAPSLLVRKSNNALIEPLEVRMQSVISFIRRANPLVEEIEVFPINDVVGPAGTVWFDRLFLSLESVTGGKYVNDVRAMRNLPPLELQILPVVGDSVKSKMSSTQLRNSILNRLNLTDTKLVEQLHHTWDKLWTIEIPEMTLMMGSVSCTGEYHDLIEKWFFRIIKKISNLQNESERRLKIQKMLNISSTASLKARLMSFLEGVEDELGRRQLAEEMSSALIKGGFGKETRRVIRLCGGGFSETDFTNNLMKTLDVSYY